VFDRSKYGKFPEWDLQRRLDHVRATAANYLADERRNYEDMLDDLRASGPKPAEESEAA